MHSITDILNILLRSVFVGFGFVIPILALIKTSNLKALEVKDLFILTAVQAIRVSGIIYFVLALVAAYPYFANSGPVGNVNVDFTGYGLTMLFSPLMYLLLSQLFWIKKLYMKKTALITLSILLLILPSHRLMMYVSSFSGSDKDYLPGSWTMSVQTFSPAIEFLLNIIVFIFIIFTIILLGGKLKDKKA